MWWLLMDGHWSDWIYSKATSSHRSKIQNMNLKHATEICWGTFSSESLHATSISDGDRARYAASCSLIYLPLVFWSCSTRGGDLMQASSKLVTALFHVCADLSVGFPCLKSPRVHKCNKTKGFIRLKMSREDCCISDGLEVFCCDEN
jgi:hypothetical protein